MLVIMSAIAWNDDISGYKGTYLCPLTILFVLFLKIEHSTFNI